MSDHMYTDCMTFSFRWKLVKSIYILVALLGCYVILLLVYEKGPNRGPNYGLKKEKKN